MTMRGSVAQRPRSPSHAAKNKTPADRVWEFGNILYEFESRLMCRACNLALDHTRKSTIVEHLRSRKHHRLFNGLGVESPASNFAAILSDLPIVLSRDLEEESECAPCNASLPAQAISGPYLLKKETHCSSVLDQLLKDDIYTDVTLTAEGQHVKAHKIVLCMASSYFREVLSREPGVQCVVILKDIKFCQLKNILNFIYTGEATVDAGDLEAFMRTAELLEITSLSEGQKTIGARFPSGVFGSSGPEDASPSPACATPPPPKTSSSSSKRHVDAAASKPQTKRRNMGAHYAQERDHLVASSSSSSSGVLREDGSPSMTIVKEEPLEMEEMEASLSTHAVMEHLDDPLKVDDGGGSPPQDDPEHLRDPEPRMCPFCESGKALDGSDLMNHLVVAHPTKASFPCEQCWRVFRRKSLLKSHQKSCLKEARSPSE